MIGLKGREVDGSVLVQPNGRVESLAIHPDLNYVTGNESVQVLKEERVGVNDGIGGIHVTRHEYCN
jgi:hypothetical protein